MASSSPLFKHSNQVSSSVYYKIHGRSTAQMCLKKIIDIISSRSSLSPCGFSKEPSLNPQFHDGLEHEANGSTGKTRALFSTKRGFDIDLNLRLGPPPEGVESETPTDNRGFSACSAVGEAIDDGKTCRIIVDCNSSAASGDVSTVDKSSEGECDPKEAGNSSGAFPAGEVNRDEHDGREAAGEETKEFSEITNLQARSSEIGSKRVREETEDVEQQSEIKAEKADEEEEQEEQEQSQEKRQEKEDDEEAEGEDGEDRRLSWKREYKSEGYLGLLVEAARLISGNFEDHGPEPEKTSQDCNLRQEAATEIRRRMEPEIETKESIGCRSKRNGEWTLDFYEGFEDISPVVRSKRGRNQVLPYRYRDSVLEPWKRLSRQRSARVSARPKTK